ncbi:MAG: hypothetical protein ACHQIK_00875 [Candidatus Acidiferrales bacterium]
MPIVSLKRSEQLRRLAGRCVTYAVLFLIGSLPLYSTRMYRRIFITAVTTGLCYGAASIITGYFDRWGWRRVTSLNDWKTIVREFFSAQDNRL